MPACIFIFIWISVAPAQQSPCLISNAPFESTELPFTAHRPAFALLLCYLPFFFL